MKAWILEKQGPVEERPLKLVHLPTPHPKENEVRLKIHVCGVCHTVHNSENWIRLWAQDLGGGEGILDMLCTGCHSQNGPAAKKVPEVSSHPEVKVKGAGRNEKGKSGYFPLFHKSYGEKVPMENVSCASCHDVHRWNPDRSAEGHGVNAEGDAVSSFLRSRSSSICPIFS